MTSCHITWRHVAQVTSCYAKKWVALFIGNCQQSTYVLGSVSRGLSISLKGLCVQRDYGLRSREVHQHWGVFILFYFILRFTHFWQICSKQGPWKSYLNEGIKNSYDIHLYTKIGGVPSQGFFFVSFPGRQNCRHSEYWQMHCYKNDRIEKTWCKMEKSLGHGRLIPRMADFSWAFLV